MLPTFVIGLREGLEASLIVSIVAAFLRQRGRSDLLRWVFVGIFAAVALCTTAGVILDVISRNLPQRQQEGLETVIGLVAVAMVTYMVVWMKRHSRNLKGQLDHSAGLALAAGSGLALVAMAFLAVLREGLETVVFLLAAFNESGSGNSAAVGAVLGIVTAVALGYAIYRGGVRLNLSKFFRATGVVLVLVAAGLVVNALHTAHEAGWLNIGQQSTVDLSTVVRPGSVQSSLLTGMLGLQSQPVLIEVLGWLLYLVPVGLYVAWPPGKGLRRSTVRRLALVGGGASVVAAVALAFVVPARPVAHPLTVAGSATARVVAETPNGLVIRTDVETPAEATAHGATTTLTATAAGRALYRGIDADVYRATVRSTLPGSPTMTLTRLAALGGGRLPLGVVTANGSPVDDQLNVPVTRESLNRATVWVSGDTGRVLDVRWQQQVSLVADFSVGPSVVGSPASGAARFSTEDATNAVAAANQDSSTISDRRLVANLAIVLAVLGVALLLTWGGLGLQTSRERRRTPVVPPQRTPVGSSR